MLVLARADICTSSPDCVWSLYSTPLKVGSGWKVQQQLETYPDTSSSTAMPSDLITSFTIWSLAIPSYHQIPSHLQIPSDHQRKWKWTCRSVNWLTHHFQPIIFSVFEYHTHQCSVLNPCSFRFRSVEFKAMGVSRDEEAGRRVGREMDLALWSS